MVIDLERGRILGCSVGLVSQLSRTFKAKRERQRERKRVGEKGECLRGRILSTSRAIGDSYPPPPNPSLPYPVPNPLKKEEQCAVASSHDATDPLVTSSLPLLPSHLKPAQSQASTFRSPQRCFHQPQLSLPAQHQAGTPLAFTPSTLSDRTGASQPANSPTSFSSIPQVMAWIGQDLGYLSGFFGDLRSLFGDRSQIGSDTSVNLDFVPSQVLLQHPVELPFPLLSSHVLLLPRRDYRG